jgi:hypothetical protein
VNRPRSGVWARVWARAGEHRRELLLLKEFDVRTVALVPASTNRSAVSEELSRPAHRDSPETLVGRLNLEWARLSTAPVSCAAVLDWATGRPALAGAASLDDILMLISRADSSARDAALLALLELAQHGDRLAGRTVLQTMLGKAVRVAAMVTDRPDVAGDREESLSVAVAALWQVIATYPVASRRSRVAANLAMDTVAIVHRGHTGSSYHRRSFPEVPRADVSAAGGGVQLSTQADVDTVSGPVDAELFEVLAWAVRDGVLQLSEARLLARVYAVDEDGTPVDARAVAVQEGLSWSALRQRCHRLARRLRDALTHPAASRVALGASPGSSAPSTGRTRTATGSRPQPAVGVPPIPATGVHSMRTPRVREQRGPRRLLGARGGLPLRPVAERSDALPRCGPASGPWPGPWSVRRGARPTLTHSWTVPLAATAGPVRTSAGPAGSGCNRSRTVCGRCRGSGRRRTRPRLATCPVDSSSDQVESRRSLDLGFLATKRCPNRRDRRGDPLAAGQKRRHAMHRRRHRRSAAVLSLGLSGALLLSTGCRNGNTDIKSSAPSPLATNSQDASIPDATVTPPPVVPSEEQAILEQYRKFFAIQTALIQAPAAERPQMFATVATDPSY